MQNKNYKIGSLKEHSRVLTNVVEPPKSSRNQLTNSKSEKEFSFINNNNQVAAAVEGLSQAKGALNTSKGVSSNAKLTANSNAAVGVTKTVNFVKSEKAFDYPVQRRIGGTSTSLVTTTDHKLVAN